MKYIGAHVSAFKSHCANCGYGPGQILPHGSYPVNLGHPLVEGLKQSRKGIVDAMQRCESLGLRNLNFHPGCHAVLAEFDRLVGYNKLL